MWSSTGWGWLVGRDTHRGAEKEGRSEIALKENP